MAKRRKQKRQKINIQKAISLLKGKEPERLFKATGSIWTYSVIFDKNKQRTNNLTEEQAIKLQNALVSAWDFGALIKFN